MSRCRAGIWSQFLHRVGFTCTRCHQNVCGLLPRISTLTTCVAVYFCCTFLKVAFTGRYPALLLCGARTFLVRKFPRNRLAVFYVTYCITNWKNCQSKTAVRCFLWQNKAIFHLRKVFLLITIVILHVCTRILPLKWHIFCLTVTIFVYINCQTIFFLV